MNILKNYFNSRICKKRVNTNCFTETKYKKKATAIEDVTYSLLISLRIELSESLGIELSENRFLPKFAPELRKWLHVLPVLFAEDSWPLVLPAAVQRPFIWADRFTALLTLAFSGGHRTILSYGSTLSVERDIAQVKETWRSSNDNSTCVLNSMCWPEPQQIVMDSQS